MDRPAPDQFPCPHRGDVLYQVDCGCSDRSRKTDVYVCVIEGECTVESTGKTYVKKLRPPTTQARVPACISCPMLPKTESDQMSEKPEVPPEVSESKPTEPVSIVPWRQSRMNYSDDVKMVVKMLVQYLDSLPAGHPQRLPGFMMQGLKDAYNIMENDIVITVMSDGSLKVGNAA